MLCMGEITPTRSLQILSTIISRICLCALVKVKYHYVDEKLLSAWGRGVMGCMSAYAVIWMFHPQLCIAMLPQKW